MKYRIHRMLALVICLAVIASFVGITPVSANSAQTIWSGVTSSGVIVEDADCPLIVEKELLTFDIPEFPENYYDSVEDFVQYQASVTAQYTFYNPSDYTVTATLAFPFGNMPDYGMIVDHETGSWAHETQEHTRQYGVQVNGEPIESKLRHTFADPYGKFELNVDLPRLRDGYAADPFFSPDMTVTRYVYAVSMLEQTDAYASCTLQEDTSRKIYAEGFSSFSRDEDTVSYGCWTENQKQMILYAVGEPFQQQPQWEIFEDGLEEKELEGTVTLVDTQTMAFTQFALADYDQDSGILETDWYNAFVDELNAQYWEEYGADLSFNLMRWFEYQITLQPGERITNTVTAPMYPGINGQYDPAKYEYKYLLSPATTWYEFGELEIVINTPYYLLDESSQNFAKTEKGYALTLEGLPEGELEFTLSASEKPEKTASDYFPFIMILLWIILVTFVPITAIIVIVLMVVRLVRNLRNQNEKT